MGRLLLAVGILVLGACDGVDVGRPLTSGPASNTLFTPPEEGGGSEVNAEQIAESVCNKLFACQVGELGELGEEMEQCVELVSKSTAMVIDGAAFVACVEGLTCASLTPNRIGEMLISCLDIDLSSMGCVGSSLHYCNKQAVCRDLPCKTFCETLGLSGDRCAMSEEGPQCKCVHDVVQPSVDAGP